MCLAIPMQIIHLEGEKAICRAKGVEREVSLFLLQGQPLAVGDFVMVHVAMPSRRWRPRRRRRPGRCGGHWARQTMMHELSIARALLRQVGRVSVAHGGARVRRVRVRLGPLSGVEPALLAAAFPQACQDTPHAGAVLEIERVPVRVRCLACGQEHEGAPNRLRCPACGSADTTLVGGDELLLVSVDLEERVHV